MLVFYLFFAGCALIPLWFLLHSAIRYLRHHRDGRQTHSQKRPKRHYIKRVCALILACVSLFEAIDETSTMLSWGEIVVKCVFFAANCAAWMVSFALLRFEYERGLGISWVGHRGFWLASFATYLACAVFQAFETWPVAGNYTMPWIRVSLYLLSCALCFSLSLIGLFKPNDFFYSDQRTLTASLVSPMRTSSLGLSSELSDINIQMDNFKKKVVDGKGVDLYEISVTIRDATVVLWKTYCDFDVLSRRIKDKFEGEFPILTLPRLPEFSQHDSIDSRLQALKQYLDDLCFPAFYCEELLDFLSVTGDSRELLLKEHFKVTGTVRGLRNNASASMSGSILVPTARPASNAGGFFDVAIVDWRQAEADGHIEYDVHWRLKPDCLPELPATVREGRVKRRFNEFYLLHKALKQDLSPARLPDFPSKTYLSRLLRGVDKEAVEYRRRALEHYLRWTLNDPAYLAPRLLDFIQCKGLTNIEILYVHQRRKNDIKLSAPVEWEYELDDRNEQFIIYTLSLERGGRYWTVRHRYREFSCLHQHLLTRACSPLLGEFSLRCGDLPTLPKKAMQLATRQEIESRRKGLELYVTELLQVPMALEAVALREFLEDLSE